MTELGHRLRQRRLELHLTQDDLAERLCVTRQAVSNWERGKTEPDLETLSRLAAALGIGSGALLSAEASALSSYKIVLRRRLPQVLAAGTLLGLTRWATVPLERFQQEHYLCGAQIFLVLLGFLPACFLLSFSLADLLHTAGLRPFPTPLQKVLRAAAWTMLFLFLYGAVPLIQVGTQALHCMLSGQQNITLFGWPLPFLNLWSRLFFRSWGQLQAELFCVSLLFAFSQPVSKSAPFQRHKASK